MWPSLLAFPDGNRETYAYDSARRVTDLRHQTSSGAVLDQFTYTYNAVSNRLSVTRPDQQVAYTYDLLDRLTQALQRGRPQGQLLKTPMRRNLS